MLKSFDAIADKFYTWISIPCKGRHWLLYAVMLSLLLSLFTSFPDETAYGKQRSGEFNAVMLKAEHPFTQLYFGEDSHSSKIAFRLTMPVLIHVSGMNPLAITVFEYSCGILFLMLCALIIFRETENKAYAFLFCLAVGQTAVGSSFFTDENATFDSIAILLLTVAIFSKNPLIIFVSVFAAAFTDERALPASSFVLLYHLWKDTGTKKFADIFHVLRNKACIGIMLSWTTYFVCRMLLSFCTDLKTGKGGVGLYLFAENIGSLPSGLWSAFEGLWLPVVAALILLIKTRSVLKFLMISGSLAVCITVSMSVLDITRSMIYMFPVLFVSFLCLKKSSDLWMKRIIFWALVLSLLWPNYQTCGQSRFILWAASVPVRLMSEWISLEP